jgi:hypothetical protein
MSLGADHGLGIGERRDDVLEALVGAPEAALMLCEQERKAEGRELIADRLGLSSEGLDHGRDEPHVGKALDHPAGGLLVVATAGRLCDPVANEGRFPLGELGQCIPEPSALRGADPFGGLRERGVVDRQALDGVATSRRRGDGGGDAQPCLGPSPALRVLSDRAVTRRTPPRRFASATKPACSSGVSLTPPPLRCTGSAPGS